MYIPNPHLTFGHQTPHRVALAQLVDHCALTARKGGCWCLSSDCTVPISKGTAAK
ncbi:hypothetical protein BofuT4_uP017490.1 [Botrytis cinerea T4]|uniref:Uncharacterized protein n=1 Tax=Botryotinia fuckeliana (strain T4) TaxID=999810 RepID=G2YIA6_BOTF4|nr:hypothetical protein BofuT4_uP017490.1 [Botrytis cinerea T4]